ncbi:MAG: flavodoxin family protein [Candidatus Bathyarchaeota archaeon]|nr:flavodoxin family protein [Candidatus Bathyarchaeota archaeon]
MNGKVMVGYMSQTGNTKKVAEAIYETIQGEKTIANLNQLENLEGYDIAFIGYPIVQEGPPSKAVNFLAEHGQGKKIALFVTHGAGLSLPPLQDWLQKCRDAAGNSELLGVFNCQGEVSQKVRDMMASSDVPKLQMYAKMAYLADGQPDAENLERARVFAQGIMEGI